MAYEEWLFNKYHHGLETLATRNFGVTTNYLPGKTINFINLTIIGSLYLVKKLHYNFNFIIEFSVSLYCFSLQPRRNYWYV